MMLAFAVVSALLQSANGFWLEESCEPTKESDDLDDATETWMDDSYGDKNVRFLGLERNGTRWRLMVLLNNFTKISDMEWISKLQRMDSVDLIPLCDDKIEILADAADVAFVRSMFEGENAENDDDDTSYISDDSDLELLVPKQNETKLVHTNPEPVWDHEDAICAFQKYYRSMYQSPMIAKLMRAMFILCVVGGFVFLPISPFLYVYMRDSA